MPSTIVAMISPEYRGSCVPPSDHGKNFQFAHTDGLFEFSLPPPVGCAYDDGGGPP